MQLRNYLQNSLIVLSITIFAPRDGFTQDARVVHPLKSFSDFSSKTDSLKRYQSEYGVAQYDYLITFIEIRKVYGNVERFGSIVIKGDSVIRHVHTKPSIVGDLFADNPVISDSASEGFIQEKVARKDRKWIKRLEGLDGFYSQNTRVGREEFYPRNWIRYLVIFNKSGAYFGFIKYGTYDVDYRKMGQSDEEVLKWLVGFTF